MNIQSENQGGINEELRQDGKTLANAAADRLHGEVEARKSPLVGQARSVSSALDKAAGELGDGQGAQWIKSAFEQGAQQVQRLADTIEQKDSRELADIVRRFARENPATFLFGCAAAGFAASRIFRAEPVGAPSAEQGWEDTWPLPPTDDSTVQPGAGASGISAGEAI